MTGGNLNHDNLTIADHTDDIGSSTKPAEQKARGTLHLPVSPWPISPGPASYSKFQLEVLSDGRLLLFRVPPGPQIHLGW